MGYLDNGVLYNNAGQRVPNNWLNRKVYLGKKGSNGTSSGIESFFENVFNGIRSWFVGKTGQALTGAEEQANEFAHNEAQLAFDRELEASNTAYQRKVADLQAAGINPMMAASSGVSLPSSSAASSVSPGAGTFQLAELINLYRMKQMLPLEKAAASAQIENTKAQTDKTKADVEHQRVVNKYIERSEQLRLEGQKLANDLSVTQKSKLQQDIRTAEQELKKLVAETKNEEDKNELILAQSLVQNATARRLTEMLPYEKALSAAQNEAARASAVSAFAQAAWQNGLIDNGMISIAVEQAGYQRDSAEYNSAIDRVRSQVSGDMPIDGASPVVDNLIKAFGKAKHFIWK